MVDQSKKQYMLLNGTTNNLYPIEQACRDVCKATNNMCTVFAVYDMCKDELDHYLELKSNATTAVSEYKRLDEVNQTEPGIPYWFL